MESARVAACYWICGRGLRPAEPEMSGGFAFVDAAGTLMATPDPVIAEALMALIERFPAAGTVHEICPKNVSPENYRKILAALMKMVSLGMLSLATEPIGCADKTPEWPRAWFLCASDAASGEPATATLRHENFKFDPVARALLPLLDGSRDIDGLRDYLFELIRTGAMTVRDEAGEAINEVARLREVIAKSVSKCLNALTEAAVFVSPI
jgi:hypothetical protein